MSIFDKLLEIDPKKLEKQKKEYEIKRISEAIGEKFILTCKPLTSEEVEHIGEIYNNNSDIKIYTIIEACRIEGKKLSDKRLMNKFEAVTPLQLVQRLLLPGEIYEIYDIINKLSGYSGDSVQEIKN